MIRAIVQRFIKPWYYRLQFTKADLFVLLPVFRKFLRPVFTFKLFCRSRTVPLFYILIVFNSCFSDYIQSVRCHTYVPFCLALLSLITFNKMVGYIILCSAKAHMDVYNAIFYYIYTFSALDNDVNVSNCWCILLRTNM